MVEFLANEYETIYEAPKGMAVFSYTPAICVLDNGRYVFTNDLGGSDNVKIEEYNCVVPNPSNGDVCIGQIFTSDDKGKTWQRRAVRNFAHARPFVSGPSVYVLGHCEDLVIYRSDDNGETWDEGHYLTQGEVWHQSACAYWVEDGYITLVMENSFNYPGEFKIDWNVESLAPVVMRAKIGDDLTLRENWTFSNKVRFRDVIDTDDIDYFGIPFYTTRKHENEYDDGRVFTEMPGWLESNVVRIKDPNHYWYDPEGKTFHIFMRTHTARSGYCALMKAVISEENGKEVITVEPQIEPSGKKVIYLPMPGGQMRFHVLWDEKTKLYWLLSTQCTDSMTRKELLPPERFNIPCDERDRLQLSFSKNMVDWCFAGFVAKGESSKQSRHYCCMAIDGDDLILVSRSGNKDSFSAHNTNLATFHRIKDFRELVY